MIGFRINPWCRWCWMLMTPAFCLVRKRIQGYSLALHCASLLRTSFMSNSVRTLKHGGFCFKAGLPRGAQGKLLLSFKRVWWPIIFFSFLQWAVNFFSRINTLCRHISGAEKRGVIGNLCVSKHVLVNIITCNELLPIYKLLLLLLLKEHEDPPIFFFNINKELVTFDENLTGMTSVKLWDYYRITSIFFRFLILRPFWILPFHSP